MTHDLERQRRLFVESLEDAVDALAMAGEGKKHLACMMRPELADEPERARTWFLNCQNPSRQENFHPKHIQRACRYGRSIGCHVLKHWLDEDAEYLPSQPGTPKSKRVELLEQDARLAQQRLEIAKQLEKVDASEEIRRAKRLQAVE